MGLRRNLSGEAGIAGSSQMSFRGQWAANTAYYNGDVVQYTGMLFITTADQAPASGFPWASWTSLDSDPVGTIKLYGGSTTSIPQQGGYLACNGNAVSRTTYAALFAAIGTYFGAGDGSTTFTLPDLRGRVPMGPSGFAPGGNFTPGATGGASTHTHGLTAAGVASHAHPLSNAGQAKVVIGATASPNFYMSRVTSPSWTANVQNGWSGAAVASTQVEGLGTGLIGNTDAATAGLTGSTDAPDQGLPPYQVCLYMIKAQ